MPEVSLLLVLIVLVALFFDFTNGANDSANAIATIVSTQVLSPRAAVIMAAVLNLLGALAGTKVAMTIGGGIVHADMIAGCRVLVLAALVGAIVWNLITRYLGIPSSSSHALIGGLVGAAITHGGWTAVDYHSLGTKVVFPLVLSPVAGFIGGYALMVVLVWVSFNAHPRKAGKFFRRAQLLSSGLVAANHGLNDAQKTMGIITLALVLFQVIDKNHVYVPFWVKMGCALAMGLGTATGGWKIIKTMGHRIFRLDPIHGFAAETGASMVIGAASAFGAPVSTTHTIACTILGVGSSKRFSAVRWGVAGDMVVAWILTIPAAALVSAACLCLLKWIGLGR